jgi:mannose-6-phosphate isomerase-like protein (cupin superfamily)
MSEPNIVPGKEARSESQSPISAMGGSFGIYEWSGSGPDYLHVHHSDDEAWHVLEGTLTFKLATRWWTLLQDHSICACWDSTYVL